MKDINIRHEMVKLLEENVGKIFLILTMVSWNWHQKHKQQKEK